MSHNLNASDYSEDLQKLAPLISSFRSALKDKDLWHVVDIVNKMRNSIKDHRTRKILIDSGVIKSVVKLIGPRYHRQERLMIYCSWLLTNIAAKDHESVQHIVDLGVIKQAIGLLRHPNSEVKQNCAWLLGNIAGKSFKFRDLLIRKENIVEHVEWLLNSAAPRPSLLEPVAFLISNLTTGEPYPPFYQVAPLLKYLAYFVDNVKNKEVLSESLWSLSWLSDANGDDDQLQCIYDLDIGSKLISCAQNDNLDIQTPALRTLGNMVIEYNDQVEALVNQGLLKAFSIGLECDITEIQKKICWGLSNVLAQNLGLIEQVFEFEDGVIIEKLIKIFEIEDCKEVLECLHCFNNISAVGNIEHIDVLVNYEVIEMSVSKLQRMQPTFKIEEEISMNKLFLSILESILKRYDENPDYEKFEKVMKKLKYCDGFAMIKNLENHPYYCVDDIVARLIKLMEDHWD